MSHYTDPHFDGDDYDPGKDHHRLTKQIGRVLDYMSDGLWHTLSDISKATGAPEASASAQLRNLRKDRFGARHIERQRAIGGRGLYQYRLLKPGHQLEFAPA